MSYRSGFLLRLGPDGRDLSGSYSPAGVPSGTGPPVGRPGPRDLTVAIVHSSCRAGCGWPLGRTRPLFCWPSLSDSATACERRFAASRRERRSPLTGAGTQLLAFPGFKPSATFSVSGSPMAWGLFIRTSLPDGRTPGKFQIVPVRFGNREAPILRAGAAVSRRSSGYPRRTRLFCNRTLQPNEKRACRFISAPVNLLPNTLPKPHSGSAGTAEHTGRTASLPEKVRREPKIPV